MRQIHLLLRKSFWLILILASLYSNNFLKAQVGSVIDTRIVTVAGQYLDSKGASHDVEVWSVINTRSGDKDYFVLIFPKVGSPPYPIITQVDGYNVFPSPPSTNQEDSLWTDRVQRNLPNYDVSLSPQDSIKTCSTPQCTIFVPGIASLSNLTSLMPHMDMDWALTNGYGIAIAFARFYAARDILTDIYGITNILEALKSIPLIDGNRIGIIGGSRGGELSIHPLANPYRPLSIAASVPEYSWVDAPAFYDYLYNILPQIQPPNLLAQSHDFAAPFTNRFYKTFGTDTNSSGWQQVTINRVASTFNTPVLLLSGSDDLMIPVAQTNDFYASLKSLGKKANRWIYNNGAPLYATKSLAEGAHGILDTNSSIKMSFLARNFFLQHMPPNVSEVVYNLPSDVDLIGMLAEFRNAIFNSPSDKQNISELIIHAANPKIKYVSSDSRIPTSNGPAAIAAAINIVWVNEGIVWTAENVINNLRAGLLPTPSSANVRVITSITPISGPKGTTITFRGSNLSSTVHAYDPADNLTSLTGTINPAKTKVTLIVPDNALIAVYRLKMGPTPSDVSNEVTFTVTADTEPISENEPSTPPTITDINPGTAIPGQQVEIYGTNLDKNIWLISQSSNDAFSVEGSVNFERTLATFETPAELIAESYDITVINSKGSATANQSLAVEVGGQPFRQPVSPTAPTEGLPVGLGKLIEQIFTWSLSILGISVFVMFFYSGFLWLTAAGNTSRIGEAKTHMTNAVFGTILLLSAYLILYTINPDFIRGTFNLPGLGVTK